MCIRFTLLLHLEISSLVCFTHKLHRNCGIFHFFWSSHRPPPPSNFFCSSLREGVPLYVFLAYLIDSSFSLQSQNIMRCSPVTMPRFPVEGIYDFAALPLFISFTQGFRPQIPYNRSKFRSLNIETWLLLLTRKLRRRHRQPSIISGDEDAHWSLFHSLSLTNLNYYFRAQRKPSLI